MLCPKSSRGRLSVASLCLTVLFAPSLAGCDSEEGGEFGQESEALEFDAEAEKMVHTEESDFYALPEGGAEEVEEDELPEIRLNPGVAGIADELASP